MVMSHKRNLALRFGWLCIVVFVVLVLVLVVVLVVVVVVVVLVVGSTVDFVAFDV